MRTAHPRTGAIWILIALAAATSARADYPDYVPTREVHGPLRVWGSGNMARVLRAWEAGFRRYHPDATFTESLKGSSTGIFGLTENVADFAVMGREMYTYESYGIYRRSLQLPVKIAVANGSFDVPRKSFALAVFVNQDNPLVRLSLEQLDGIFGAERSGGWQGLNWAQSAARTARGNIRTWGQLGLGGAWADKPIHPYGPPGLYPGGVSFFQTRVLHGGDTMNEDLREYPSPQAMIAALAADPLGIAYTGLRYRTPGVRALPIAATANGPYVVLSRETVADESYPLSRRIYIYYAPDLPTGEVTADHGDPRVKEFLRFVLSRQGQACVQGEGDYLPLTEAAVRAELKKLE